MSLVIRDTTIAELEATSNIYALLDEYSAESSIKGLPPINPSLPIYKMLEQSGAMTIIAAYVHETLVGYVTVLCSKSPHYSVMLGTTESFFVLSEYRSTGAGAKLLKAAEQRAKEKGAVAFLISSPFNGRLAAILPSCGYTETNRVFFKGFANE